MAKTFGDLLWILQTTQVVLHNLAASFYTLVKIGKISFIVFKQVLNVMYLIYSLVYFWVYLFDMSTV